MPRALRTISLAAALLLLTAGIAAADSVKGRVVSSKDGRPVPRALVVFERGGSEVVRTSTASDGTFFIKDLAAGTYTVRIARDGKRKEFPGVEVPCGELRFEL